MTKKPQHAPLFKIPATKLRNTKYADRDRRMIFRVIAERGRGKRSNLYQPRGSWIQENAYSQLKTLSGLLPKPTTQLVSSPLQNNLSKSVSFSYIGTYMMTAEISPLNT